MWTYIAHTRSTSNALKTLILVKEKCLECPLAEVVKKYDVNIQAFADDTQLYRHCFRDEMATTVLRLEQCLKEVSHWMSANRLKLNADKTELLRAGSKQCILQKQIRALSGTF